MKNKKLLILAFIILIGLVVLMVLGLRAGRQKSSQMVTDQTSTSAEKILDISGSYYTLDGDTATIKKNGDKWRISYETSEGSIFADFQLDWQSDGDDRKSETKMRKSDGNDDFSIKIVVKNWQKDPTPLTLVTMTDGDSNHELSYANQKDYFTKNAIKNDSILQGDLTAFEGTYSSDYLEQTIADSGFTLYGYNPSDYYDNKTTVFPSLSQIDGQWSFWSGATHAQFKLNTDKKPKQVNGYYEAYFVGVNNMAIPGQEITLTLIPANIIGPDGIKSKEKRILYGQTYFRSYQENWWENYPEPQTELDLDIPAIESGDFTSLVGTWQNGKGNVITINADGTTNDGNHIQAIPNSSSRSSVPYVGLSQGMTGAAIGLLKIGFQNPEGDQSDTSRPRLIIAQQMGNYPADMYYYRK